MLQPLQKASKLLFSQDFKVILLHLPLLLGLRLLQKVHQELPSSNRPPLDPLLSTATSSGRPPGVVPLMSPSNPVTLGVPFPPLIDPVRSSSHPPASDLPVSFPNSSEDHSYLSSAEVPITLTPTPNTLTPPSSAPTLPERFTPSASSQAPSLIGTDSTQGMNHVSFR